MKKIFNLFSFLFKRVIKLVFLENIGVLLLSFICLDFFFIDKFLWFFLIFFVFVMVLLCRNCFIFEIVDFNVVLFWEDFCFVVKLFLENLIVFLESL